MWFGYLHELCFDIKFIFRFVTDGVYRLYLDVYFMAKGMAYDGLSFPGMGCHATDTGNVYLIWNYECILYCFCICPSSYDVSVHGHSCWKTNWTNYRGPFFFYQIYILNRLIPLAVWAADEPLASCLVSAPLECNWRTSLRNYLISLK